MKYPDTERSDQTDVYHGVTVADPYRWLENPDSEATKAWVKAENEVTFKYLKQLPNRKAIQDRLTQLWNYERFGLPRSRRGKYFYTRNNGLQNQSVLLVADSLTGEPHELIDPNKWTKDGTADLAAWTPSDDGKLLAYAKATAGSDWKEWFVLNVETGEQLSDHLKWVKFSGVSWTPDSAGFYYSRYDEPKEGEEFTGSNYFQKLYYHKLRDDQSADQLIYERKDEKEWGFGGHVTEDGKLLIISVWKGSERKNQLFYKRLDQPDAKVVELITGFDAEYDYLGNYGDTLYVLTDADAPNRRVMAIDLTNPEVENWQELIAERKEVLESISLTGNQFMAEYLQDAKSVVHIYDLTGKRTRELKLPGIGSVGGFGGLRDATETFYYFTGYTQPTTIYHYDLATGKSKVFKSPDVPIDSSQYETRQVFFKSTDGAKVPMFITYKKGIQWDGKRPTILYAYGGFNISLTPGYSPANMAWIEAGGVYAVANLRGGGEYGRQWHEAGMKENKQQVFDDFISAAEYLTKNNYTSTKHLAIRGGSNGGLLVGAVMAQRPDLFGVALPAVGVMDMLRYHKFTIGWAWVGEFGSADDEAEFKTLLAYSPLHNLKKGVRYPATLVTTADHDDRVVPAHSFKFAAELQQAQAVDGPPTLIRIETSAGHGAGKPTTKRIEEAADIFAFTASFIGDDMSWKSE